MTPEGVRIEIQGPRDRERTQVGDEEAELRESAHEALRKAGLLDRPFGRAAELIQLPFFVTRE